MAKSAKKKNSRKCDVSLLEKERKALRRHHRKVVFFNDREMALINEYCKSHKISSRSAMMRSIVIERILTDMGENPPTLF